MLAEERAAAGRTRTRVVLFPLPNSWHYIR
jgi:hypothetical protein